MSIMRKLLSSGLSEDAAYCISGDVQNSVIALGSTQSDAFRITQDVTVFTTVIPGSGAILPVNSAQNDSVCIINESSNVLNVYPPLGEGINNLQTNYAFQLQPGFILLKKTQANKWLITNLHRSGSYDKYTVPLWDSSLFTQTTTGVSSVSIDTLNKVSVLSVPNTGTGTGSNRILLTSLEQTLDSSSLEVVARVKIENGDVNSRAFIVLASTTSDDTYVVTLWGDGTVERGASISGTWSSGGYTSSSTLVTDGTGWLRLRSVGSQLIAAFGVGTVTSQPARWALLTNTSYTFAGNGMPQFNRLELGGGQYTSASSSTLRVEFSDVHIKKI